MVLRSLAEVSIRIPTETLDDIVSCECAYERVGCVLWRVRSDVFPACKTHGAQQDEPDWVDSLLIGGMMTVFYPVFKLLGNSNAGGPNATKETFVKAGVLGTAAAGLTAVSKLVFMERPATFCRGLIVAFMAARIDLGLSVDPAWIVEMRRDATEKLDPHNPDDQTWFHVITELETLARKGVHKPRRTPPRYAFKHKISESNVLRSGIMVRTHLPRSIHEHEYKCIRVEDHSITFLV